MTNEIVKIPFGSSIGKVEDFSKRIDLKKGVKLIDARLVINATQTYLSGSNVTIAMNGQVLEPSLVWDAFANSKVGKTYQVSTLLRDGVNKFSVVYTTAFGVLSDQSAIVNAELNILLEKPEQGKPGIATGDTVEDNLGEKIVRGARESINVIVGLGILAAVLMTGYGYAVHESKK
jgi:hypothetical protein